MSYSLHITCDWVRQVCRHQTDVTDTQMWAVMHSTVSYINPLYVNMINHDQGRT